jgi:hypothetical protein
MRPRPRVPFSGAAGTIPVHVFAVADNGDGTAQMAFDAAILMVDIPAGGMTLNGGGVNQATQLDAVSVNISSNAYVGSGDPWAITGAVSWISFINGGTLVFPQSGNVS